MGKKNFQKPLAGGMAWAKFFVPILMGALLLLFE
jgi:hypothetical protein